MDPAEQGPDPTSDVQSLGDRIKKEHWGKCHNLLKFPRLTLLKPDSRSQLHLLLPLNPQLHQWSPMVHMFHIHPHSLTVAVSKTLSPRMLPEVSTEINLEKRSPYCSLGWSRFNGHCYRYIATPMSWSRAEKNCQSMNANLASVHNIGEYYKIQRLIFKRSYTYKETWIGGSDAQQEKRWLWSDGTPFRFTYWCSGKPNNFRTQNCLRINYGGQRCWTDFQCYYLRPSVCSKKAWPILG
ncbi:type-2 ice-structuring protein-like [Fundulus diaphanus]